MKSVAAWAISDPIDPKSATPFCSRLSKDGTDETLKPLPIARSLSDPASLPRSPVTAFSVSSTVVRISLFVSRIFDVVSAVSRATA